MSDLFHLERFKTRRQFIQWGLLAGGISAAALKLNAGKAWAAKSVKIPPIPKTDEYLDLSFNPMMVLRDFDYGTLKEENGQTVREFEVYAHSTPIQLNSAITFVSWNLNDRVPAPTLRATEGDRVRIIFHNQDGHSHSLHFHNKNYRSLTLLSLILNTCKVLLQNKLSININKDFMSTRIKTIELFLAFGLATTVGTQTLPSNAYEADEMVDNPTSDYLLLAQDAEGGKGGEAGTSTSNSDVDYMTTLGLMKGHLIAARELIELKNYEQAEPHIGHPVEKLYSGIEPMLPEKGVQDFKPTLNQLHDLAQSAPNSPEMQTLFDESLASINQAIAAIAESQRNSPELTMDVIVEMLKTAATEYEAAIANNQFLEVVEYHDFKGFVLYADELYQTIAEQKSQTDPEEHQTITDSMAKLKTV